MTVHVLATFVARPDTVKQVRDLLGGVVQTIREDPGCLRCYMVMNTADETEIVFIEEWRGTQELERHLADPAIAGVVEKVAPLLAQPFVLKQHVEA